MAEKLTKEEIRQAFFDMADEMEKNLGDWQRLPDNPELRDRILAAVTELEEKKRRT